MSELKPTEKGYIEALAVIEYPKQSIYDTERIKYAEFTAPRREGFNKGYTLALEHNNVPELIEAVKELVYELTGEQEDEQELEKGLGIRLCSLTLRAKNMVTKAEQNKLIK